ncbi:acetyl/propionyl/methylcrotonyl-CoA carboxylase subunit alpha [Neoaquamicrobium sediminum]|uniref:acetyl/propionyl/methylcrotonyl-CoA carboxylase subunit alpha n=1 Tax=Neoaquamicrobium sediminum TaxID=1849104 RepID=UPI0036171BFA
MIAKLLIANRGEIACRIIRTAKRMGIGTVAVFSDVDADALHVRMADRAVRIGPAPAAQSYLRVEAIIEAAIQSGADAIHPGYGFLSENADFAEACLAADILFVGPPVEAIRSMGDKANAKALMRAAAVPVVPGYDGDDQSDATFAAEAERIGFPVLVKASAGGGGRGMRRVRSAGELAGALESARQEAAAAFGSDRLLLEKLIEDARHVEVQVFADNHGTVVHLGERDCSTQRRHQKIIEETPSPFVDAPMRQAMTKAAVEAARAVNYAGAGTVEFIVGSDRTFFFLEMNTRLQVEHPVTEMVTGLDLVEWQLRVAAGERLPHTQESISFSGYAIEARLCAEDPAAGFAPQTGKVIHWRPEAAAIPGVRIDHGIDEGGEVTPFYDPMIAKVIAHATTRDEAVATLARALRATPLLGVVSNRGFLLELLESETLGAGAVTTGMLDAAERPTTAPSDEDFAAAVSVLALADGDDWFSSTGRRRCPITLRAGETTKECSANFERGRLVSIDVGEANIAASSIETHGSLHVREGRAVWIDRASRTFRFDEPDPMQRDAAAADGRVVVTPVSGLLRRVDVAVGDSVRSGTVVGIVEAMKMETALTARMDGIVNAVRGKTGDQVRAGDVLIEIAGEQ